MDKTAFLSKQLVQDAVIRNLEIIGEASSNIEKHTTLSSRVLRGVNPPHIPGCVQPAWLHTAPDRPP
ncbi:DUF86 domain-containing protein [Ectothiorhodospira haloalkaliphila]|nr:DUF86 domain-containing protein [Ectothiorhodospira haloalkaliphila]